MVLQCPFQLLCIGLVNLASVQVPVPVAVFHFQSTASAGSISLSYEYQLGKQKPEGELYAEENNDQWGEPHTGTQIGTGTRDDCPQVSSALTALMPSTNWGKTTSEHPTLWFYVPYTSEQVVRGELVLQKTDGSDLIDPIQFNLPNTPGFVSVTLPGSSLSIGTDYYWAFQLYCRSHSRTPVSVEGWIQRVRPDDNLEHQLRSAGATTYQVYWENLIWFDGVDDLMQQRLRQPSNQMLITGWIQFMEDGRLNTEPLPTGPILGEVLLKP